MLVYVLLSAFFLSRPDSCASSLLPVPSPPQRGAGLQPWLAAEEVFAVLPRLTCLQDVGGLSDSVAAFLC